MQLTGKFPPRYFRRNKSQPLQAYLLLILSVSLLTGATPVPDNENKDTIKIGLLIPDAGSLAAKKGAEIAIKSANEKAGENGILFRLVVSSMEGPWGAGSRVAVKMIFDDSVCAILGSHDGRNAHLVEQVSAKSRVPLLSAWSGDPTLTQAFIPWFFNIVPDDIQQASALENAVYNRSKLTRIAVIAGSDYDSKSTLNNFLKLLSKNKRPEPLLFSLDNDYEKIPDILEKIKAANIGGIVVFVQPPASLKIAEQLKISHIELQVFGTLALLDENKIRGNDIRLYEGFIIVAPDCCSGTGISLFCDEYKKVYGIYPGVVACYAYDGMNLLIEAIRKAGTDYNLIRRSLSEIKYEGVTGTISFNGQGNLVGTPGLVEIRNGIPVLLR